MGNWVVKDSLETVGSDFYNIGQPLMHYPSVKLDLLEQQESIGRRAL
jgi:hypothetical protein